MKSKNTKFNNNLKIYLLLFLLVGISLSAQLPPGYGPKPSTTAISFNGDFSNIGGTTQIAGVVKPNSPATTVGSTNPALQIKSQATFLPNGGYRTDAQTSSNYNTYSIMSGTKAAGFPFTGALLNSFPGDPANNVAAATNYLYSNGNVFPGQEYIIWEQTLNNLVAGRWYTFSMYVNNAIEPPTNTPDDPVVRLKLGGTSGLPNGTTVAGPTTLTEAATGSSQPMGGWIRVEHTFQATATTQIFKVTSAASGTWGDDFQMTQVNVVEYAPILNATSNALVCLGSTLTLTASTPATGAMTYSWTGPDGFTSSLPNPTRPNMQSSFYGDYVVTITDAAGASRTETVTVLQPPAHDTDGDGINDYCDLDDDNDGILDTNECSASTNIAINNLTVITAGSYTPDANNLVVGDRLFKDNIVLNGTTYDAVVTIKSLYNPTPVGRPTPSRLVLNTGNLSLNGYAAQNPYVIYTVRIVQDNSISSATPDGTGINLNGITLTFSDIDGATPRDQTDVFGINNASTPEYMNIGSALSYNGFLSGGPGASYGRFIRTPNTVAPGVPAADVNYWVDAYYGSYDSSITTNNEFVFGMTGNENTAISNRLFFNNINIECDTDNDGTPNRIDLDSDNDGCPDVIEGGANFTSGASYITNNALNTTVNSSGVPAVPSATPAITGYDQTNGQTVNQAYTVNPTAVAGVISATSPICSGSTSTISVTTAPQGAIFQWQRSTASDFSTGITNLGSALTTAPTTFTTSALTSTTYFRLLVTSAGGCTKVSNIVTVTVNATPVIPNIVTTSPTCTANGTATIENYDSTYTYTFSPTGPTVGTGGLISGYSYGTAYTVTATLNSCTSSASSPFYVYAKLNCTDTDGDGIYDSEDLDDDNDGILDTVECPSSIKFSEDFSSYVNSTTPVAPLSGTNVETGYPYKNPIGSTTAPGGYAVALNANSYFGSVLNTGGNASIVFDGNNSNNGEKLVFKAKNIGITQGKAYTFEFKYHIGGSLPGPTFYVYVDPDGVAGTASPILINSISTTSTTGYALQKLTSNWTATANSTAAEFYIVNNNYLGGNVGRNWILDDIKVISYDCDTDGDNVPDTLDLDSDNDGCPDAIEGDENVTAAHLNPSGSIIVGANGSGSLEVNANGVPKLVNGTTHNATGGGSTAAGVADIGNDQGQGIGDSQNIMVNSQCNAFCYKPAQTTGTTLDTNHGITALGRAGADNSNWPMVRKGAWTALEAKTKGFVVNRLTDAQIAAIPSTDLREGMMVYNIDQDCLQINIDGTATGWKCFNTQTCPDL